MSRLIVRGLPSYLTDVRLRKHFSQKGAVTDVKLMRRPDGTSRKFGFVGYRSEAEAQQALDYFNHTFIDTSRISVEFAKKLGDEDLEKQREERRNKRKAADEAASSLAAAGGGDGAASSKKSKTVDDKARSENAATKPNKKGDVTFEEFLSVMQPKSKRKAWQNEDALPEQTLLDITAPNDALEKKAAKKARKAAEAAAAAAQTDGGSGVGLSADGAATTTAADSDDSDDEAEPDAVANDAGLTDAEYMQLRMKHRVGTDLEGVKDFEQSDDEQLPSLKHDDHDHRSDSDSDSDSEDETPQDPQTLKRQEAQRRRAQEAARKDQETVDQIMQSGRLFVRNLPFSATEQELQSFFQSFGTVTQAHIPLDKQTKSAKGIAFISFAEATAALAAYRAKDGATFQGRLMHIIPAITQDAKSAVGEGALEGDRKKSLKQARLELRKQDAAKDFNWSMLYMSSDAVASSIADRLGVEKSDILNPAAAGAGADGGSDNAAVRLALAETRIIQETKEFFQQEGINVDAFESGNGDGGDGSNRTPRARAQRSDTTILVKNIPYGTTVEEVQKLFEEHGEVDKVLIPPSGTIAVVEMPVVAEARLAFRAIAYKRFRTGILYLEKAPVGLFAPSNPDQEGKEGERQKTIKQAPLVGKSIGESKSAAATATATAVSLDATDVGEEEAEAADGATLFVKNLSFATSSERLAGALHGLSDFAFARVQTKPDPKRPGARLSMGYGFVGFQSISAAKSALKVMDGKVVDGHTLAVTFARRNNSDAATTAGASASAKSTAARGEATKILIKNLPFEATKRDVRQLFSSQGQIKSVRLPKKFDNSTRGFGFVEYTSAREAQSAFEALKHTHLLGRHLVLQWSNQPQSTQDHVDQQRAKTKSSRLTQQASAASQTQKEKLKLSHEDIIAASRVEKKNRVDIDDDDDDDDDDE
ncbi:RNA-binding domain-containing protein [Testicularia cyperi]|uniref:Multiple RNA-binding domain-containing protein 1 n=1 Tax=Testicularia cyperi TaxID=1882483 RepID=A0A317XUD7_9BASI|nr:RNA-binding domain-containing protein [Testicularia cyperi]